VENEYKLLACVCLLWEFGQSIIGTGSRLDSQSSVPRKGKVFSCAWHFHTGSAPPSQSPIQWVPEGLCSGLKWLGHEADHSPSTSVEVMNDGAVSSWYAMVWCLIN
jgi:hypothetical protein